MSNHVIKAAASRNLSSRTRKRLFCDVDGASGINPSVSNSIKKRGFSDARNNLAGKMLTPPIPDCQKGPFGTLGARLAAAVAVVGTRRNEGERRESSAPKAERAAGPSVGLDTGCKGTRGGGGYRDGHLDSLLRSSTHRYQRGLSRPLEVILSASQGHRLRTFPEWGNIALLLLPNEEPFSRRGECAS